MSRSSLPFGGLRAFEAAARNLSFANAAEELHVTPAAVSHQIRTLEALLGVQLFRRRGRRVFLTDAGQTLLPELRRGFDLLEAGLAQVRRLSSQGILTVSMSPSFATKWFVPRIERFRATHQDIDLRIDANSRPVDFAAEQVDVAIRYGRGQYAGLVSTPLFDEELFPVCSPRLQQGRVPLRSPADLARHTLLHDETPNMAGPPPSWREWLDTIGSTDAIPLDRGLRFTSSATAVQAAIEGQGVLLGRSRIVEADLAAGRLVRPFAEAYPAGFGYHLVYPSGHVTRRDLQAFVSWIVQER